MTVSRLSTILNSRFFLNLREAATAAEDHWLLPLAEPPPDSDRICPFECFMAFLGGVDEGHVEQDGDQDNGLVCERNDEMDSEEHL